jgi:hypothetical protein
MTPVSFVRPKCPWPFFQASSSKMPGLLRPSFFRRTTPCIQPTWVFRATSRSVFFDQNALGLFFLLLSHENARTSATFLFSKDGGMDSTHLGFPRQNNPSHFFDQNALGPFFSPIPRNCPDFLDLPFFPRMAVLNEHTWLFGTMTPLSFFDLFDQNTLGRFSGLLLEIARTSATFLFSKDGAFDSTHLGFPRENKPRSFF